MNIDIIEYSKKAHEAAKAKGWWDEVKPMETYLMLIISELAECMEADRKGKRADIAQFEGYENKLKNLFERNSPDAIGHWQIGFESFIKDSIEDELADAAIRIFDLLGYRNFLFLQEKFDRTCNTMRPGDLSVQLFGIVKECLRVEDLPYTLRRIFFLAESLDIDLVWHIDQKMKYNETRSHRHGGKAY